MKRAILAADIFSGFVIATLLSLGALGSFWLIELAGSHLKLGWDATAIKDMKVIGTIATFLMYYIVELRNLWRGNSSDAD